MKFYCDGTNLSNAANTVSKALAVNKNIPILEGIKLEASENKLTLSAYNQEIYIYAESETAIQKQIMTLRL